MSAECYLQISKITPEISELKSKYFKIQIAHDFELYKKQKNYYSKFYKKERKTYYNNMNLKNLNGNGRCETIFIT